MNEAQKKELELLISKYPESARTIRQQAKDAGYTGSLDHLVLVNLRIKALNGAHNE